MSPASASVWVYTLTPCVHTHTLRKKGYAIAGFVFLYYRLLKEVPNSVL